MKKKHDHHEIEETSKYSEEKLKGILNNASDVTKNIENANIGVIVAQDGKLVFYNTKFADMLGYTQKEFKEISFLTKIHEEDRAYAIERIRKRMQGVELKPEFAQIRVITKSEQIKWIEIYSSIIEWKGKPALQSFVTDITNRKNAESALAESEEKFKNLAEQSPNMIFINKKGKVVYANKRSSEILGYKRDEYYSENFNFLTLIAPESIEIIMKAFARHRNEQEVEPYEYTLITKEGQRIEAIITTKLIDYEGDKAILGIITDITERKKIEDKLKNSEARYHSLFNNANDAVFIMDFDTFIDCNKKTLEIFNCTKEQIIGKNPYGLFSPELQYDGRKSKEKARKKIQLAHNGKPQFFQWLHIKYDGTPFDAEVSLNPIEIERKTYIHAQVRDITEKKKAEENILRYQNQLKSLASQLTLSEEKERYRIATELHDHIGQYLAVSMMKLDELLSISDSGEKEKTIEQINQWLRHAMNESQSLTFDLSSPVLHELGFERAVAAWLEDEVQGKHNIITEFQSDGIPKSLNEEFCVLLFRSVREILFNVIKHANAKKVKVYIKVLDNNIKIRVEDNGVGFKPDETAANAFSQSKFGLFSIRERLEHFGGNIEIDSKPGHGCRITLIAPLENQ